MNEWRNLCAHKILFAKAGSRLNLKYLHMLETWELQSVGSHSLGVNFLVVTCMYPQDIQYAEAGTGASLG